MMKKRVLPLLLVCSAMLCQPAMAMDQIQADFVGVSTTQDEGIIPFASDYIGSYEGKLKHTGNGVLVLDGYVDALGVDKVEIVAQVQVYSGGKWTNKGTALKESDQGLSVKMDRERIVTDGKYRVKYTFNAYVGTKVVESRSYTTSSVTVSK